MFDIVNSRDFYQKLLEDFDEFMNDRHQRCEVKLRVRRAKAWQGRIWALFRHRTIFD